VIDASGRDTRGQGNASAKILVTMTGDEAGTEVSVHTDLSITGKVAQFGDNLYFFVHVRDEFQSYAVTPAECIAHWLADSTEILIDPRGDSSATNFDTGTTFMLGIFPFTNDPANFNGNGVNAMCFERDADNHQGYSTGPLAATVDSPPNAPGVQVVSTATWVGTNDTGTDHSYGAAGGYNLEVKIPMADLPSAVGPTSSALGARASTTISIAASSTRSPTAPTRRCRTHWQCWCANA